MTRQTKSLPIICSSPPPGFEIERGGWCDPFVAGFNLLIVRCLGDVTGMVESQSVVSFAAAYRALFEAYKGRCVCLGCDTAKVNLLDLDNGLVIATFNDDDHDCHLLTGCGVCPACAVHPGLRARATKGLTHVLSTAFEQEKARQRN